MSLPTTKTTEMDRPSLASSNSRVGTTVVFDLPGTLKRLGGDQTILADLAKLFREDSPALVQRLQAAFEAENFGQIQHSAHSLRGLAANFGAAGLIDPLKELEELASHGSINGASKLIETVRRERARLETELLPYE